ncbi:histone-lysine N-methyltransferase 2A isoform X2 [Centruroides vittatus]|uniref:histone-lysine N-methyltransferase 2A isoform X2 n=1 Tax=Centruroides vittatus TaxID=120091 RepID=UPI00351019CC
MRTLQWKSYNKMIKDGLSGLWKRENISRSNLIFSESKQIVKTEDASCDKIQNTIKSNNKTDSLNSFQHNQHRHSSENAAKNLLKKAKNHLGKVTNHKCSHENNDSSLSNIKSENISERRNSKVHEGTEPKDKVVLPNKRRKCTSFPLSSVRTSQRITQKKRLSEEGGQSNISNKETTSEPSKEEKINLKQTPVSVNKSVVKHKPRYISYEWVPVRSLGSLEQPLVVDGKRKWKPSLKVQTNCDPYKTRRKKYNKLSVKVKKQSLRYPKLYTRGARKRRKHKSPWGLRRYNKSVNKESVFKTRFRRKSQSKTDDESKNISSIINDSVPEVTDISDCNENKSNNSQQEQVSSKLEIFKEENVDNAEEINNLLWKEGQTTGTVICAVCKQIKFYVHMKRRYGQFCCDACSKFFTWFLRKPEQFYCTSAGCCDFSPVYSVEKGLSSSQFCKACWIKVCLEKFIVPIYTQKKLTNFMPKFQQIISSTNSSVVLSTSSIVSPAPFSVPSVVSSVPLPVQPVVPDKEISSTESSQEIQKSTKSCENLIQNSFNKLTSGISEQLETKDIKLCKPTCNFEFEDSTDIEIELDESLISELEKICDETSNKINLADGERYSDKLSLTFDVKLNEIPSLKTDNISNSENLNSNKLNLCGDEIFDQKTLLNVDKTDLTYTAQVDPESSNKVNNSETLNKTINENKEISLDDDDDDDKISKSEHLNNIENSSIDFMSDILFKTQLPVAELTNNLDFNLEQTNQEKNAESNIPSIPDSKQLDDGKTSDSKKLLLTRKHYRSLKRKDSNTPSLSKTLLNKKRLKKQNEADDKFIKSRKNSSGTDDELKNSLDIDDLPVDELIRRASEKDTKDIIIIRKSEKQDNLNKSPSTYVKNGLKSPNSKENSVRIRKVRCKRCEGCKAVDCEKCVFCLDKKKFGGNNLIRKACINRRCRKPQMPSYPKSVGLRKRQSLNLSGESNQGSNEVKGAIIYNSNELNDNYVTIQSTNEPKVEIIQKQKEYTAWKKSSAAKTCLVYVNYWEEYDPDRILNQGFPLISSEMLPIKYVCYLCGSTGLDNQFQFIFCSLCCEPFHSFCLDEETFNDRFDEETWCCQSCQSCIVCGLKENLLKCKVCMKCYHLECIGPDYPSKPSKKNVWVCPTCMKCKSCSGTIQKGSVWNFDLPYCSKCSLRKTKGSYCPICQLSYDNNDYESKMMQCAKCHLWVHAKCDDITDDMYEVLSCLPETVIYTCPCCAQEVECMWLNAVYDELTRGLKSILSAFVNAEIVNNSNHQEDLGPQLESSKYPDIFKKKHCEIRLPPGLPNSTDGKTDKLIVILNKLERREYTVLSNFYEEVLSLPQLNNVARAHKVDKLNKLIKLYFPWFEHSQWDKESSKPSDCHVVKPPYDDHNYAIYKISSVQKESLTQPGKLRSGKDDPRKCVLCGIFGDATPNECGRLIYCGQNDWVHINCALWSAEVFEEIDGSLQNVHPAISRGRSMRCESCKNKGATVGCCIRGCPANYHFKCAREEKAIFQEDKKVYCDNHRDWADEKKIGDDSFFVKHSMYVDQDQLSPKWRKKTWQSGLPAGCVHVTIGSLTIENLGYLTPASDRSDALVPVEFVATRLFWSTRNPRQRVTYRIRTIEVIPETETMEKVASPHHTIAHNVDKNDRRNKISNVWKFKGSALRRNNLYSECSLESSVAHLDQNKSLFDFNSENSPLVSNTLQDLNKKNEEIELSKNTSVYDEKSSSTLNASNKEDSIHNNSFSSKILNSNQLIASKIDQMDQTSNDLLLGTISKDMICKLTSTPKIKDDKKSDDDLISQKNEIINKISQNISEVKTSKSVPNEDDCTSSNNQVPIIEHLEPSNKINNQILELKVNNNKDKNEVENKNEDNTYQSVDHQLPSEEVENICPKLPERKCTLKNILKTYPLRSRRYQESIKLLKHYTDKNQITMNIKKRLKHKKYKDISFPTNNINEICDDINNNEAGIHLETMENSNKTRQLRRTPARLYFEHLTKHKLLFKKKRNLNNIFNNKKSNCNNHRKNKLNSCKNSEFLPNNKNHLYQIPLDFAVQKSNNLNNLVNNEIVVAVGEIENFGYCMDSKESENQNNERFADQSKDFANEKTFKCKNCKRQYRTWDSCRKHEMNCDFIVDSSSSDEEEINMLPNSQEENRSANDEINYSNREELNDDDNDEDGSNNDDDNDNDKQSLISTTDSASEPYYKDDNDFSEECTESNILSNSSVSTDVYNENSFQQNCSNFNIEKSKKKESNQKFILPKPNVNVVNSYTSTISESSFNIQSSENSMLVFNQPEEATHNLNNSYILPSQTDMNAARPICIQNTCQLFTAGLNIVQNPNLSYLGSITISNQELVSMAFNVQDSSMQVPSGIIMDQVQTSQIASNMQLPIVNFPVLNPQLPNTQTFVPHPTIMNPQQPLMYLNPVLTQTQVSESVFIMNSESSQPVVYEMPRNAAVQPAVQSAGFIPSSNEFNTANLEQPWLANSLPVNNMHSSVDTSSNQDLKSDLPQNSDRLLHKSISVETDRVNEEQSITNGNVQSTASKSSLKRSTSPKNLEKCNLSKCNSALSELQKLTTNKPLIEVIQKAAQQMLKLTYKNYADVNQKTNSDETKNNEKPCSTTKSCASHSRSKYKAARIRRNSTSSENDIFSSNVTSGKTSRRSSIQDDTSDNMSSKNNDEKNHPSNKPYIMFEISNEDGLCIKSANIDEAWKNVLDQVQDACTAAHLKRKNISQNGIDGLSVMGLTNNAVRYLLEQLPGAKNCVNYNFLFHPPHPEEEELPLNPTGCARSEPFLTRKDYDMFNFLASKHRCPPQYQPYLRDEEMKHKSSRRATSIDLPMAMRFRHLKNSAKEAVGVYRSQIHGRGLFCKRNIDAGEMIIEYAGEVIRSILTDSREAYYESKGIGCYMFRIDDNEVVDATMHGNAARFINHSCEPNCYSKVINVDGKKHIVIFALKRILKGEELTYNYKFPIEDEKIPCTCGSKRCRKYLN